MKRNLFFTWLLTIITLNIFATEYTINSVDEFNDLNLSAGDVVIWQNGSYSSDERIKFLGNGTANNPITLKAETPGEVIFTGGLQMDIAGNYLIVDGFYWNGGYGASNFIQFRSGTTYAQNCTIQNCAIDGLAAEPGDAAEALADGAIIKHRWIVLYGNYNNVLNCSFMNKDTAGALILAEHEYNASPDEVSNTRCEAVGHIISNNYFYNYAKQDSSLSNAGDSETIRIGTSEFQNVNSAAIINGNYFVQADGENEIISNKSMNNTYTNNTFRRCRGSLVMRHGANAIVDGNYFLGENVEGTGGIRIADSNHQITNNYIQDCISAEAQIPWNNGLTFVGGNTNSVQNCNTTSVSNAYQDVENINFSNNTFINTHSPFYFNATRDGADDVFGEVSNNLIYFEANNDNTTDVINGSYTEVGSRLSFSGNVYDGANALGENATGFSQESINVTRNGEIFSHNQSGKGASITELPITDSMVGNGIGACFLGAEGNNQTACDETTIDSLVTSTLNNFEADGGSQTINITSNVNWTVSENTSWISINRDNGSNNGSVTITTTENTSTNNRTASITIEGAGISRTINILQNGTEETTDPTNDSCTEGTNLASNGTIADFSAEQNSTNTVTNILNENDRWSAQTFPQYATIDLGNEYNVNQVNLATLQNRDYQFIVDGSTTSATSGFSTLVDATNNSSPGTITETFTTQTVRYVRLTITGANTYSGEWASITQFEVICAGGNTPPPAEVLNVSSINDFSANGGSQSVTVTSNTDWTVSENSSWVSINTNNGSDDGSFIISTSENTNTSDRSATVTVTSAEITRTINIIQEGAEDITPISTLTISTSSNNFDADGGSETVNITSNIAWSVTENTSWISINTNNGNNNDTIIITASENTTTSNRSATITISGDDISREITITQTGSEPTDNSTSCNEGTNLALNGTIASFSTQENTTNNAANTIDGNPNNRWSAMTFPQNIVVDLGDSYNVNEINVLPFNDRAYQFTVEGSNTSATNGFSILTDATNNTNGGSNINRTFDTTEVQYVRLTITGASGYSGAWASIEDFEIICAGGNTPPPSEVLNVSSVNDFSATGDSQSVTVTSNTDWTVSENTSWISVNTNSGSDNGSFTITTSENTSTSDRSATITVTGSDITRSINITQEGAEEQIPDNFLTVNSLNDFTANESTQTINISSNTSWSVSENASWISLSNTNGTNNGTITVTAERNTSTSNRSATITISGDDISRTVTVNQEGEEEVIDNTETCSNGTNLALNANIVNFSNQENTTNAANNVNDGNPNNRWSAITFPQDVVIDLGANYNVNEINLFPFRDRAYQFLVEGSTTSTSNGFTTLTDATGNTNGGSTINRTFDTQSVRYVRLTITGASGYSGQWSSIEEFEVICAGNANDEEEEEEEEEITPPSTDLDPTLAPSENFDLTNWNINVPIDRQDGTGRSTNIERVEFNDGYELKDVDGRDYFYTGADGGMVFKNYPKDAPRTSPNTSYSRTELREILTDNTSADADENNWYFSSSDDIPSDAGGVDGVLTATLAVNNVTTNGNRVHQGRVIVGQIHASRNEPNRLYYHKLPEHDKGAIYVAHEDFSGDEVFFNIIGNYVKETGGGSGDLVDDVEEPADGIELNEVFSYRIEVVGNDQWVTISRDGKEDIVQYIDMSDSDYENDWMYFKAGAYSQNNTTSLDDDFDQVTFYALEQSHNNTSNKSLTKSAINNEISVYPNPFSEVLHINFGDADSNVTSIIVIDMSGRIIFNQERANNESNITINNKFNDGIYIVQCLDANGNIISTKKAIHK